MKRTKLMWMSLVATAIVGGTLAFKAAKLSPVRVCTTATVAGTCITNGLTLTCGNVLPTFTLTYTASAIGARCCTTVPATITNCNQTKCALKCTATTEVAP